MACIFDIKRYAIHDGPGIRITIFFKGCPLSCVWCHNPEGIARQPQKMYTRKKCIGCGFCIRSCAAGALTLTSEGIQTDLKKCTVCGECAAICPAKAMEISGREYSIEEVMEEIRKETLFMEQSGGGVTFCGGEPLMQPQALLELLHQCGKEGIHRVVDTTLYASPAIVRRVMEQTDLFLVDLKMMDPARHRFYCGVPNGPVLDNLRLIAEAGKSFYIRIPLIKDVNATPENVHATASFLAGLPWKEKRVELLPYHDIAINKHQKLGSSYNPEGWTLAAPEEFLIESLREIFHTYSLETCMG
ncbi:MAG: glycyl-radical enzyme activating protein [Tannerellaceae bacterium]|nr:glycyl-radical enzyme activating protein [Tannerellaceae bacterium]